MLSKGHKLSRLGPNQQKVLLLLAGGVGLSLARTSKQYFRVIKEVSKEWQNINRRSLESAIRSLYRSKLVSERENSDGSLTMILTDGGKKRVITFDIDNIKIKKPKIWDKKWRLVLFDIPERHKPAREALRGTLRRLGFREYQKSVFVHPHPCQEEIDFIVEFFYIRPWVKVVIASSLDNEFYFRKLFNIS